MVPAEVQNGAQFLDRRLGQSWIEEVNLDILDITSGCSCVAAQVIGGYEGRHDNAWENAMFEWGIVTPDTPEEIEGVDYPRARELGFLGDEEHEGGATWGELENGWRELISDRVAARAT